MKQSECFVYQCSIVSRTKFEIRWIFILKIINKNVIVSHNCHAYSTCCISTAQVSIYITSLSADKNNLHVNFLKPLETVLLRVIDHFELLGAVIYYWHYICYDLLGHMVRTLNLNDTERELERYNSHVESKTSFIL